MSGCCHKGAAASHSCCWRPAAPDIRCWRHFLLRSARTRPNVWPGQRFRFVTDTREQVWLEPSLHAEVGAAANRHTFGACRIFPVNFAGHPKPIGPKYPE